MIPDPTTLRWRKSSYSSGQNGNCVELAYLGAMRDSKNPAGPAIAVGDLQTFLCAVRQDRLGAHRA